MTLYYTLVFVLLLVEMGVFMFLILPLPFTWRKAVFTFISENPFVAKLQYGMKITFVFILILFIDSVNRVYSVTNELSRSNSRDGGTHAVLGHERMEVQARKFYSQRNMYLCGFTLFLSLILNRTYVLILDLLRLEQTVKELRAESNERVRNDVGGGGLAGKLEAKERELAIVKKQAEGLSREYGELSDRLIAMEKGGADKTPRKDL
ncbi:Endoplasmic reticulum transmembrane protein 3 [Maublancomyces gigas]|uniref:Endoplasmic reticulum transmembrane protein n=1 Tax=Discina gigas TaxID=1032678 RepID=A0ABR3GY34_9PEZI